MKATLEFDDDEREQLHVAVHAQDLFFTLFDMDNYLRSMIEGDVISVDPHDIRDELYRLMAERDLSFDMMS